MDSGLTGLTQRGRDRFFEALGELPAGALPIHLHLHHAYRGGQYCPPRYAEKLRTRGRAIRRHEEPRCYGNARSEMVAKAGFSPKFTFSTANRPG
jgi:hypothetical protein